MSSSLSGGRQVCKPSIDAMMEYLIKDEQKLNVVVEYLFGLLEQRSLSQASEYLALKVLNEVNCTINNDLSKQLEAYREMRIGKIASDIMWDKNVWAPGYILCRRKKLASLRMFFSIKAP